MSYPAFRSVGSSVLHYCDTGKADGPALVFSNSLGTDFRVWRAVADAFAGTHRILLMDKRGHGLSSGPLDALTIADLADDAAALMDDLGITNAVFAGLSVGGMIAQKLAAQRPDLVKGLVLSNTGHKIGTDDVWQVRIDAVLNGGIEPIADAVMERWLSEDFRKTRPVDLAGWRAMLTRTDAVGYAAVCRAIKVEDLTATTSKLTLPTLCIAGSRDGSTPPPLVREMADLIAGARFVEIDGVAHLPCVEAPDRTVSEITTFLKEIGHGC